jgi:hypothetical protein
VKIIVETTSNEFSNLAVDAKIVQGLEALVRRRLMLKDDDKVEIRTDPKGVLEGSK